MPIQWTDAQIERMRLAFEAADEQGNDETWEGHMARLLRSALAALTPDIEAHIAAEVEARVKGVREENERLREVIKNLIGGVQEWCDAINNKGTSWDDWDECYKYFAYRGGLNEARAALATPGDVT